MSFQEDATNKMAGKFSFPFFPQGSYSIAEEVVVLMIDDEFLPSYLTPMLFFIQDDDDIPSHDDLI